MNKDCIVFDLWNTLIFLPKGWETFNYLKREFDIDSVFWREKVKPLFLCKHQPDVISFLSDFRKLINIDLDESEYGELMNQRLIEDLKSCKLYEDSFDILERLKKEGYILGVISNQSTFYESYFTTCGLDEIMDACVFSNRVGVRKPDRKVYSYFLDKVGIEPRRVMMVGDNYEHDYLTPKQIGMRALWLRRGYSGGEYESISTLEELFDYL